MMNDKNSLGCIPIIYKELVAIFSAYTLQTCTVLQIVTDVLPNHNFSKLLLIYIRVRHMMTYIGMSLLNINIPTQRRRKCWQTHSMMFG